MTNEKTEVIYCIDQNDHLVEINDHWDVFANENNCHSLGKNSVYGLPIWNFITGDETRHIHRVLLKRAKSKGAIKDLPFRCDSPEYRRFMELSITPKDNGFIEYRCKLIKTEVRDTPSIFVNENNSKTTFLKMCSWCNKFEVAKDNWVEIEEAVNCLELLSGEELPGISHAMCDACMSNLEDDDN